MTIVSIDQTAMPYSSKLCFAGAACDLRTNSSELIRILDLLSIPPNNLSGEGFALQVVVELSSREAAGEPHFRGLHHVVTATFGSSNVFVFDILRRRLSATVSAVVAQDHRFWKEKLIPIMLGVLGASMGLVPVHCACLESGGDGLLVAGVSGAGKSTLSVALSENGFNYISDDWTYISHRQNRIVAHGTSAPVKLLPDAVKHFQLLQGHNLQTSMNGELAYEIDIAESFGAQVEQQCEPRWLIFLERMQQQGADFAPMLSQEVRSYINSSVEKLPLQLYAATAFRERTIDHISLLPCWRFRYGGAPQFAAEVLRRFVIGRRQQVYA